MRNRCRRMAALAAWAALAAMALAGASRAAQASQTGPEVPSTRECGAAPRLEDGWPVADAQQQGFDAARLCGAVRAFRASPLNLHGLVIERGGKLVAESYRTGRDVPWLFVVPQDVAFGPATLHDLRSISKSVVSLLWGIAQAQGHLPPIHTPVLDLFPALADLRTQGRERITVEDLLAMRSGLAWDESGRQGRFTDDESGLAWRGDIPRYVLDRMLTTAPGAAFNYNSGHTAVLAHLIEARTASQLHDYARSRLFEPLGIKQSEWRTDLRRRDMAYAGLRLRPRDLARIGRLVLADGAWNGRQLVAASWVQASFQPRVPPDERELGPDGNYGYHWWLGKVRTGSAGSFTLRAAVGDGGQLLLMVPQLDLVVVLTAGEYGNPSVTPEVRRIFTLVVEAVAGRGP